MTHTVTMELRKVFIPRDHLSPRVPERYRDELSGYHSRWVLVCTCGWTRRAVTTITAIRRKRSHLGASS